MGNFKASPSALGASATVTNITVDGDVTLDDGGSIKEAGGVAAITVDGSGHVTKLGQSTSTSGYFLKWDGSKSVWASVSSGGGADTGTANTFTEGQVVSKDTDGELIALKLVNQSDANNTTGIVSIQFDLEDTGGTAVDAAKIAVKKEAAFTATAGTQDSNMVFSTSLNGTLTEQMTLDSAGTLTCDAGVTVGSTVITDDSIVMTPSSGDTATIAAGANGTLTVTTVDAGGTAANVGFVVDGAFDIDAAGAVTIDGSAITIGGDSDVALDIDSSTLDIDASGLVTIDSVGLSIDSAGIAANITSTTDGAAEDFTISLAGATDSSLILSSTGTGADALQISTSAGGIDITATGNAAGEDIDISSAASINLTATEDAANAIYLRANGGSSETINIHSDQGTGEGESASIVVQSDDGGIAIVGNDAKDVSIDGGQLLLTSAHNVTNSIYLRANAGTDETIVIHSDQGTGEGNANASVELVSDVGGICLTATGLTGVMTDGNSDAAIQMHAAAGGVGIRSTANLEGAIQIEADGGANETISIHSDQGTGVNAKAGSTDASINLISDAGGIGLYSGINADNAIALEANGGANETIQIRSNQGTGVATADIANVVNASIALVSDVGGVGLGSAFNGDNAIRLEADGGVNETIVIHSNQGTGEDHQNSSILLVSDVGGVGITATGLTGVMTDTNSDAAVQLTALAGGIGLRTTSNLAGAIQIEADGGANETIIIKADQSTVDGAAAAGAIQLLSDVGGIGLSWNDSKDLWAEGGRAIVVANEDAADCILLHADAGTSQTIRMLNDAGTNAAAIGITSTAGGITLASGADTTVNGITVSASQTTKKAMVLTADSVTTGKGLEISTDALTTGKSVEVKSSSNNLDGAKLLDIEADSTSTDDYTMVRIKKSTSNASDSNAIIGLDVDFNATAGTAARAVKIDSEQTTGVVVELNADGVTTGKALELSADALTSGTALDITCTGTALDDGTLVSVNASGNTGSDVNNLVHIKNDHASSTGTVPLLVHQDSTGDIIKALYGANGAGWSLKMKEVSITLATDATTTDSSGFFPANAIPLAISILVTTQIDSNKHIIKIGTSTFPGLVGNTGGSDLGDNVLEQQNDVLTFAVHGSNDNFSGAAGIGTAQHLRLTLNGTPSAGVVRATLWYWQLFVDTTHD